MCLKHVKLSVLYVLYGLCLAVSVSVLNLCQSVLIMFIMCMLMFILFMFILILVCLLCSIYWYVLYVLCVLYSCDTAP